MRESGIAQPSHLAVLSRANEHTVGSKGAASQASGISLWSTHTRRRSKHSAHQVTTPPRQTSVVEALTQGFTAALPSLFFFLKTASMSCLHHPSLFKLNRYHLCFFFSHFPTSRLVSKTSIACIFTLLKNKTRPAKTSWWALFLRDFTGQTWHDAGEDSIWDHWCC